MIGSDTSVQEVHDYKRGIFLSSLHEKQYILEEKSMSLCSSPISYGPPPDSAASLLACVYMLLQFHMTLQETDRISNLGLQIPLSRQGPIFLMAQC